MSQVLSFMAGLGLGVINYRMFMKAVLGVVDDGEGAAVRRRVAGVAVFRHLFVFLAGISLIRVASFAPFPLCGGILLAHYLCRYRTYRSQQ